MTTAQDVPARLARVAGVTKGVVADWFGWRRATTGEGGGGDAGDHGLVAHAQQAQLRERNTPTRLTLTLT